MRRLSPPERKPTVPAGVDDPEPLPTYDRLAIPHSFKPQMSVLEATFAALGMFLRIVLSSLLFAVWGALSLMARSRIPNLFLRLPVLAVLLALFVLGLALLVVATRWVMHGAALLRQ
jgi:hypothetical protein